MSDLLIKGMDLPKEGRVSLIAVFSDGDVKYIDRETFLSFRLPQKAIEVPTHGDLIERSSVYKVLDDRVALYKEVGDEYNACNIACIEGDIVAIPTIIEASKVIKK